MYVLQYPQKRWYSCIRPKQSLTWRENILSYYTVQPPKARSTIGPENLNNCHLYTCSGGSTVFQISKLYLNCNPVGALHDTLELNLKNKYVLNYKTGRWKNTGDGFPPVNKHSDPKENHAYAFAVYRTKIIVISDTVNTVTSPPLQLRQALSYPDGERWAKSHDESLQKTESAHVVDWTEPAPRKSKPLQLKM